MGRTVKKFRPYTVDQFEEEQQYFEEMSSKGFHFVKYKFPFYHFHQGEPGDYQYQIDFQNLDESNKESYLQLFKDDGWEFIVGYGGVYGTWFYFRKPKSADESLRIFTDTDSKVELYGKIRRNWAFYFIFLFLVTMVPNFLLGDSFTSILLYVMWLIIAVIYAKITLRLTFKIRDLRRSEI
ncbi:MAG: DUF2812 domain-containing protein [Cytobacillus gottheilii]|uniref:DUF2812 domain-containing protein n=1 Tax=Cytobacillus gottheilii TaxID=859144 RepID=UPI003464C283